MCGQLALVVRGTPKILEVSGTKPGQIWEISGPLRRGISRRCSEHTYPRSCPHARFYLGLG